MGLGDAGLRRGPMPVRAISAAQMTAASSKRDLNLTGEDLLPKTLNQVRSGPQQLSLQVADRCPLARCHPHSPLPFIDV